jgi:hypothetical protein
MDTEKGLIYTAVLGAPSRSGLWKSALRLADMGTKRLPDRPLPGSFESLVHPPRKDILGRKSDRAMNQSFPDSGAGFQDQFAHTDLMF